jgi:hypothetical protein
MPQTPAPQIAVPPASAPSEGGAVAAPGTATRSAACEALVSTEEPFMERARTKPRALGNCVGGWIKGELQEFKDGFNKIRSKLLPSR